MKKTLIWILVIGVMAALIFMVWYRSVSKHDDPLDSKDKVILTAEELFKLYQTNEDSANKLYLDKTISITGSIKGIELNDNRYTITFNTTDSNGAVICEMDTMENIRLKTLQPNANVNVVGFCNGFLMDVQLDRCKLAK